MFSISQFLDTTATLFLTEGNPSNFGDFLDLLTEIAEDRVDFEMSDEAFAEFLKYHLARCEKRELLGASSHLLYICRKE